MMRSTKLDMYIKFAPRRYVGFVNTSPYYYCCEVRNRFIRKIKFFAFHPKDHEIIFQATAKLTKKHHVVSHHFGWDQRKFIWIDGHNTNIEWNDYKNEDRIKLLKRFHAIYKRLERARQSVDPHHVS